MYCFFGTCLWLIGVFNFEFSSQTPLKGNLCDGWYPFTHSFYVTRPDVIVAEGESRTLIGWWIFVYYEYPISFLVSPLLTALLHAQWRAIFSAFSFCPWCLCRLCSYVMWRHLPSVVISITGSIVVMWREQHPIVHSEDFLFPDARAAHSFIAVCDVTRTQVLTLGEECTILGKMSLYRIRLTVMLCALVFTFHVWYRDTFWLTICKIRSFLRPVHTIWLVGSDSVGS